MEIYLKSKLLQINYEIENLMSLNETDSGIFYLEAQRDLLDEIIKKYEEKESEIFAKKIWTRADIGERLDVLGYIPSSENIDAVIDSGGKWPYLNDCTEEELNCIDEEIEIAMNKED